MIRQSGKDVIWSRKERVTHPLPWLIFPPNYGLLERTGVCTPGYKNRGKSERRERERVQKKNSMEIWLYIVLKRSEKRDCIKAATGKP